MPTRAKIWSLEAVLLISMAAWSRPVAAAGTSYSVGYGGRVTNAAGAPIQGPVDLKVSFYRTLTGGEPILAAPLDFPATTLTQGVFQLTLTLSAGDYSAVFTDVSNPVYIQVTDTTHAVAYPRQKFLMVPYAAKVPVDGATVTYDASGQLTLANPPGTGPKSLVQLDDASRLPAVDGSQLKNVTAAGFTGKLAGDVTGGQTTTTVAKIQGQPLVAIGATSGQVMTWNGTQWGPAVPTAASSGPVNLNQASAATGTLAAANGGTGSSTALNNNSLMISSGGTIVEAPALSSGQIFIGASGAAPAAATLAPGATQGVTIAPGAGSLTLDTVQDIRASATPQFSGLTLSSPAAGSLVKVGAGGTLTAAAAADLGTTLGYTPVNKAGDSMAGNLTTAGTLGIGTTSASTALDIAGALTGRGSVAPAVAPAGQGRIYFDQSSNQFMVSQNSGAYAPLVLGGTITGVNTGPGLSGGGTSGSVTLDLNAAGTPGTYTKVQTDTYGRVTGSMTLTAADIPPLSATILTSGTLPASVIPALSAAQVTSGTLATAQIPTLPATQIISGTFATAQIPTLPLNQLSGTLALAQIPALPAAQITSGTLALAQIPLVPSSQITGTFSGAQLPALSMGEITTGTLAVALGGTGATSFTASGVVTGGGAGPLSATAAGSNFQVLTVSGGQPAFGALNLGAAAAVSGTLPVASGGTGSSAALSNNRLMLSTGGAIVEAPALGNGQLFIGSAGSAPAAATLTQGATHGVTVTTGAGSLTLDTAQDIRTSATPLFSGLTLSSPAAGSLVKVGAGGTLSAAAGGDVTSALGYTPVNKAGDTMTGPLALGGFDLTNVGNLALAPLGTLTLGAFASDPTGLTSSDVGKTWFNTASNQLKYWDGTTSQALGVAGAGLSNLNSQTGTVQTFGTPGTGGLSPSWNSASNVHTLSIPLASAVGVTAGLLSNTDYQSFTGKVSKTGDTMSGSLGIGTTSAETTLDIAGALTQRATAAPGVPPSGLGRIYFDQTSNQFIVSQNGGAYAVLASGGTITGVTPGTGLAGGGTSGNVTLSLTNVGTAGAYTKVLTDAYGRVTSGASLAASDIPALSAAILTSGTLSTSVIPALPATQVTSGTFAAAQMPTLPATQLTGTLALSQLPALPATQITSGTLALALIPQVPANQITGTLAAAQIPALPATQITGTFSTAQLPSLAVGEITTGTLAVAFGGTGANIFTSNGLVVGGGPGPLSATAAGSQYNILTVNASNQPVFGQLNLGAAAAVSGTLPVTSGGTGQAAALSNNRLMWSSGGAVVEAPALTNGQLFIGASGAAPAAATLAQGATHGVTVTTGAGTLTLDTAQDIRTSATPLYAGLALSSPAVGSVVKVGTGGTLAAAAAADLTTALGYTPVNKAGDTGVGPLVLAANTALGLGTYATDPSGLLTSDKGKTWFNTSSSQVRYWDGASVQTLGVTSSGLTSLNGQTGNTQSFAVPGISGLSPTWSSASNVHTLDIPLASGAGVTAGLLGNADYQTFTGKASKAGDTMTGTLNLPANGLTVGTSELVVSGGNVSIGTTSAETALDVAGALTERGIAAPPSSPSGQGRIYFDQTSNQFMISQNGGGYTAFATGTISAVNPGAGMTGGGSSGNVTLGLSTVGTAGTYTKVLTDANGRVTSGTLLAASDIPALPATILTSGTLQPSVIPALSAAQITSGTFAPGQIPALPASQVSGTLALAQIPALPAAQITTGTFAALQIPALPASQFTGTLAAGQIPALPATQINGTVATAQLPSLSMGEVNTGTLAVALGGTGGTSFTSNGVVVGGGGVPLSATAAGSQYNILTVNGTNQPVFGALDLAAATAVTGTLPVVNGGTGQAAALNNNRLMWSAGGAIVEAPALTNGQLYIGASGAAPAAATLAQGATQGVTVTAGAGTLTLDTAQDIRTSATPLFSSLKLSNPAVGSVVKVGTGGTLVAAAAADLTTAFGSTPGTITAVNAGTGMSGGGATGSVTLSLNTVGTAGTYPKILTDAYGRVTSGTTLGATDLPAHSAALVTSGTLPPAVIPALPASQITSGTFAAAQIPALPASQITSGTFAAAQIPALPATLITGTLAAAQVPVLPATQITGTLAVAQIPALPATLITGTLAATQVPALPATQITGTLTVAQVPALPASQITSGTLAVAQLPAYSGALITGGTLAVAVGGTGATSFTSNGVVVGGGGSPLSATAAGSQYNVLTVNASNQPVFGALNLASTAAVSSTLPVVSGGTGQAAALNNNRLMWSAGGAIVEAPALASGQLFIGSSGAAPAAATLAQGATQGVTIATGAGTLTLDTAQDIRTSATPLFSNLTLSNPAAGSVVKVGTGGTLVAAAAADLTTALGYTPGTITAVNAGTGMSGGGTTGSVTLGLNTVGTAGTYTKVTTDADGRVTSGTAIVAGDLPAFSAALITSGTLSTSVIPALPASQFTSGTFTVAQIPALPATQLTGTLAVGQIPALPATQLTGTLAAAQLPAHSAALVTSGTLTVSVGGTGSTTALSNNKLMWSQGNEIVEAPALTSGQLFIGSSGAAPAAATLAQGATQGVTIAAGAGSLTLDTAQDIRTSATPLYSSLKLSNPAVGNFVKVGTGGTLVAAANADMASLIGYTPVSRAGDTMSGALNLPANGLTVGTSKLVVNYGNVGIGTTSASAKLQVYVAAQSTDGIETSGSDGHYLWMHPSLAGGDYNNLVQANDAGIVYSGGTNGTGGLVIVPWAAVASGIRMDLNGNVGIGTASPQQNLSVYGYLNVDQVGADTGASGGSIYHGISFGNASGEAVGSTRTAAGVSQYGLNFYTGWTEKMAITNAGYVGIGSVSPVVPLDINGYGRMSQYTSAPMACSSTIDGSLAMTSSSLLCVCNGSTSTWVLANKGSMGNVACPWVPQTCVYLLTSTSSSSWTVPSDWNSGNNTIETIGGGGGGGNACYGNGGAGGAYAKISNLTLTAGGSVSYGVGGGGGGGNAAGGSCGSNAGGNGGDTWFNGTAVSGSSVGAKGGGGGPNADSGSSTGGGAGSVGSTINSGGNGATFSSSYGGGGGGGAAGPHGNGNTGNQQSGNTGGNGGSGDAGSGGAGGTGSSSSGSNGGTGGTVTDWTANPGGATAGAGGGGGGGSANSNGTAGGPGGGYGAGGGGGGDGDGNNYQAGAAGSQGIIAITYLGTICQ